MTGAPRRQRTLLLGAGISAAPPTSLPLGSQLDLLLRQVCYEAALRLAPDAVDGAGFRVVCSRRCNALARLARFAGRSAAFGLLEAFSVVVPNEAHFLAAVHAERGALLLTLNFDDGIERAHALLAGTADLPDAAPPRLHHLLSEWRRAVRPKRPLRVVTPRTARGVDHDGPLLVKLRGSAAQGWDPSLVSADAGDDPDPSRMSAAQEEVVRAAAAARHLEVTGVSGADRDCRATLLPLLRPGYFTWTAAALDAGLAAELHKIDPEQPVRRSVTQGLRFGLPDANDLPGWPDADVTTNHFSLRLRRWRSALNDSAATRTYAELLTEAGVHDQAAALRRVLRQDGTSRHMSRLREREREITPGSGGAGRREPASP